MRLTAAVVLVLSVAAVAEPNPGRDTLVIVLQRQNGTRQTHSQSIAADDCGATIRLFKELKEKGQSLSLDLSGPTRATAEVLDIYCINEKGEGVDWHGTAVTGEQIQQRTDELITKAPK